VVVTVLPAASTARGAYSSKPHATAHESGVKALILFGSLVPVQPGRTLDSVPRWTAAVTK